MPSVLGADLALGFGFQGSKCYPGDHALVGVATDGQAVYPDPAVSVEAGVEVADRLELHRRTDVLAATDDDHRMAVQHFLAEDDRSDALFLHGADVSGETRKPQGFCRYTVGWSPSGRVSRLLVVRRQMI